MNNYKRYNVTFVKGEGNYLFDDKGRKYLDMSAGIGVNSIGYAHPEWVKAVEGQAQTLAHASNLFHTQPAQKLADEIAEKTGLHSVFFANSGAEANEALIKLARKYSFDKTDSPARHKIATLSNSFHGRTVTTLSATGQDRLHKYFDPFTEGFYHIEPNKKLELQGETCAVLIEVVQGEGGIKPLEPEFLREIQKKCADNDILFLIDEIQTGFGRCGEWFAYQNYGLTPDAISFAKGVGGGLPIGGIVAREGLKDVLSYGTHGSTFGGNPIACAGALATIEVISRLLPGIKSKGERLKLILNKKFGNSRGLGLMLGATIGDNLDDIITQLLESGIVPLTAGGGTLRLLPPLTITEKEIDEFEKKLAEIG
ncbi:MAG: acetylornithine/succinylornithine family transaminase [Clostridiales bacterium]|jgi:acetylornithine/N-succinyldiaminopimelate aminotransferase|nr:acetylornithine/succinylornithine family transaminase [Clostridiales bacterium]